jgi:hypothetical protein
LHELLLRDLAWPLRIVVGFDAYASETTFVRAFREAAAPVWNTEGPAALPSLIVDSRAVISRMNGMPWLLPVSGAMSYPLYAHTDARTPALALLDALWTRLYFRGLLTKDLRAGDPSSMAWSPVRELAIQLPTRRRR